jgi:4-hydroxy-tetrahydrodipicolinate synthase
MLSLRGSFVALVTPFTSDDRVNHALLRELVEWHIDQGTNGLVPVGTTGESPTLNYEEHEAVIETVVEAAAGRVPVVAGTGSNSTREAIHMTHHAKMVGVNGALIVLPYYNRPSQTGLIAHIERLNEIGLPLVIYNIPSRTGINMEPATFETISHLENVVGVKEASGNINQMSEIIMATAGRCDVMSGDDALTLPLLSVGGTGVVSVIANVVPREMSRLVAAWEEGNLEEALSIHQRLFPLGKAMLSLETNPGPIKEAMIMMGYDVGMVRQPLAPLSDENREKLRTLLSSMDLI